MGVRLAVVAALAVLVLAGGAAADASWTATVNDTDVTVTYEGSGTSGSPYLISNVTELQAVGHNATTLQYHYALANNIDASGTASWNNGAGFEPLGGNGQNYFGDNPGLNSFEGNNFGVNNITINSEATDDHIGLFREIKFTTIQNLTIRDINISVTGDDYPDVGGLVGTVGSLDTLITNVHVSGTITLDPSVDSRSNVGGIAGRMKSDELRKSSFDGQLSGEATIGGLFGRSDSPLTINQSKFSGSVEGNNVAGMVADLNDPLVILDSYAIFEQIDSTSFHPIAREKSSYSLTVNNSYIIINSVGSVTAYDKAFNGGDNVFMLNNSNYDAAYNITALSSNDFSGIAAVDAMAFDWGDTWRVTESFPELVAFSDGTEPAAVIIDAQTFTTDPSTPDAGVTVTVEVPINNAGGKEGSDDIRLLKSDGTQLDAQTVTVPVNTPETISLDWSSAPTDFGENTLTVANSAQTRSVDVTLNRVNIPPGRGSGGRG